MAFRYFNAAGASPTRGEAHRIETHLIPNVLKVPLGQKENCSIFGIRQMFRGEHFPAYSKIGVRDLVARGYFIPGGASQRGRWAGLRRSVSHVVRSGLRSVICDASS